MPVSSFYVLFVDMTFSSLLGVPADVSDERLKGLSKLKEDLTSSEAAVLFNVVNELATVSWNLDDI